LIVKADLQLGQGVFLSGASMPPLSERVRPRNGSDFPTLRSHIAHTNTGSLCFGRPIKQPWRRWITRRSLCSHVPTNLAKRPQKIEKQLAIFEMKI